MTTNNIVGKWVGVSASVGLAWTAAWAADPNDASPVTTPSSSAQRLEQQTNEFGKTVAKGAGVGALVGAVVGYAIGGDAKSAGKGAAAGAVVGTAGGIYIAGKQRKFANQAAALDALAADLRQGNEDLTAMVQTAEAMLAEDQQRVAQLRKQVATAAVDQANAEAVIAQLEADRQVLGKAIESAQSRLTTSRNNLLAYESKYGTEGKESLSELLTNYEGKQAALAGTDRQLAELIANAHSKG